LFTLLSVRLSDQTVTQSSVILSLIQSVVCSVIQAASKIFHAVRHHHQLFAMFYCSNSAICSLKRMDGSITESIPCYITDIPNQVILYLSIQSNEYCISSVLVSESVSLCHSTNRSHTYFLPQYVSSLYVIYLFFVFLLFFPSDTVDRNQYLLTNYSAATVSFEPTTHDIFLLLVIIFVVKAAETDKAPGLCQYMSNCCWNS